MDDRVKFALAEGDFLFSRRHSLLSLWQEVALNFYVERADFTVTRHLGAEFADHLMTSVPILVRRELGNSLSSMLRPSAKEWYHARTNRDDGPEAKYDQIDDAGRRWLQYSDKVMYRAMYDPDSQFVRATKEGDHDFASFGQCVIHVGYNRDVNTLLYRCYHLRDTAWAENGEGKIDTVHRKWKPTNIEVARLFPDHDPKIDRAIKKGAGYEEMEVRHVVMPAERWELTDEAKRKHGCPYVSVFIDKDHGTILRETPTRTLGYVIPRWQTVSGSQYAYSPATVAGLSDARTLQAMTLTLLEAGEKAASPPLIAVGQVIRSDIQAYAGGVTQVDAEYDERTGEALRPIPFDFRGLPQGTAAADRITSILQKCFFLDKLSPLPQTANKEETAYEVGQRVQDYIRNALPLFEPMEQEYNSAICTETFVKMKYGGAFGPDQWVPDSLRGQNVRYTFESPLHDAIEAQLGSKLANAKALLATVADLDPAGAQMLDATQALRDALRGIGTPARWIRSQQDMATLKEQQARQQQADALLGTLGKGAMVAKTAGEAAQALGAAGNTGMAPVQAPTNVKVAA